MKTFRNANITARNYETTNIVACQAESLEAAQAARPGAAWLECEASEIDKRGLSQLWIEGGVRIFGWM